MLFVHLQNLAAEEDGTSTTTTLAVPGKNPVGNASGDSSCHKCNAALTTEITPEIVEKVIAYLKNPPARGVVIGRHLALPGEKATWNSIYYNILPAQWDEILNIQARCCGICGTDEPRGRWNTFQTDHDHKCWPAWKSCGKCIRGLLCYKCNTRILPAVERAVDPRIVLNYLNRGNFFDWYREATCL